MASSTTLYYTPVVLRLTLHTEVVYALQGSIFRAVEARATHIFSFVTPFRFKKIKTIFVRMTKTENVKISG